jgi:hypothetical protein
MLCSQREHVVATIARSTNVFVKQQITPLTASDRYARGLDSTIMPIAGSGCADCRTLVVAVSVLIAGVVCTLVVR